MSNPTTPPVVGWSAGVSGLWSVAGNWGPQRIPKGGDDVDIDSGLGVTVTFDVGNLTIDGLALIGDTLNLQGGILSTVSGATFQNAGVIGAKAMWLGGATTIDGLTLGGSVVIANRGNVTQSGGTVAINGAAVINNVAGATWTIADASGMTQGTATGYRFINSGTFQKTSGSGYYAWIYANFLSTGTIASTVNGDIIFDGKVTKLSGTYIGAGMVDYGPDGVATLGPIDVTLSSCQSNFGTVNLIGDMTMHDGSTLQNASGAHWNFAGDVSLLLASGEAAGPDIYGPGVVAKTKGAGVSRVSVDAALTGTVSALTGTLSFEGATSTFSGTINGLGTFQIGGGAATIQSGAKLTVAHWTLAGGTTTLGETVGYAGVFSGETGAALALSGYTLNLGKAADFNGLSVSGAGTLHLIAGGTVEGLSLTSSAKLLDNGSVTQTGLTSLQTGTSLALAAGGTWGLLGGAAITQSAGGTAAGMLIGGTASNPGLLEKTGLGTAQVTATIANNAVNVSPTDLAGIEVAGGELDLTAAIVGTGSINLLGASTLKIDRGAAGGVAATQTVNFWGADETLALVALPYFHASLSGFGQTGSGDAIQILGGGYAYLGATETATSATLTFSNGVKQTLTLLGDYRSGSFSSQSIAGGLEISYSA